MRVALGCDLLDGLNCGMRIALEGFLGGVAQLGRQETFKLIHGSPFTGKSYEGFTDSVITRGAGPGSGLYWSQVKVPRCIRRLDVDVLHWPHQILPPINGPVPRVISVWDLAPMNFREDGWGALSVRVKYRWVLARALRSAAHIICHSRAVADEVMTQFDLPARRISVVYPGLSELFRSELERPALPTGEGYILYVGSCATRKNLILLLEAYRVLMNQGVENGLALLVSGTEAQKSRLLVHAAEIGIPAERITVLTAVTPADLVNVYRNAAVFGFPSLYEGFGLPLIEASAVGLPVVALNRSTMPEVLGNAGILVDDDSPQSFAEGINEALLVSRQNGKELAARAKARAASFQWTTAVEQTLAVYETVCHGGRVKSATYSLEGSG